MGKSLSFEERLAVSSSHEAVRNAKQLLKNDCLLGAWRDADGGVNAVFGEKGRHFATRVRTGEPPAAYCDCGCSGTPICEHAVAALMYGGRFRPTPLPAPVETEASYCGSLKFESWETMAVENAPKQKPAEVYITAESAFPHLPTRWENTILDVRIRCGKREYLGNLGNLRALHFDKTLSAAVELSQFSLQDRQIIRFLAMNGEADNSRISLNSEQTAELFHALIGFERFVRSNQRLIIHRAPAEAVVIAAGEGAGRVYSPGIRVGGAVLPIKSAKVITGRCGCWIGRAGEYWWIPATSDVNWLRNFFRVGEYHLTSMPEGTPEPERLPVPVCEAGALKLESPCPTILLECEFPDSSTMLLRPSFIYSGGKYPANDERLGVKNGAFFLRNDLFERSFTDQLAMFGLIRAGHGVLALKGLEKIGVFLDRMLPTFVNRRDVALSGVLAGITRGGAGVPEATLEISDPVSDESSVTVSCRMSCGGEPLDQYAVTEALKQNRRYLAAASGTIFRIGDPLAGLLRSGILKISGEKGGRWTIARHSMPFFLFLASRIPGAVPPELYVYAPDRQQHKADFRDFAGHFAGELRAYQSEGVRWLADRMNSGFNVILADEMGLGKTVQVLAMLAGTRRRGDAPALVIAPASLLENWRRETEKFVPDFRVGVLAGGARNVWDRMDDYDLLILSYAIARREENALKKHHFSVLILDEAQHIKNPGTANAHSCKAIKSAHRIVLTGTPLENSADDLWSIFDFLHPGILGTLPAFQKRYGNVRDDEAMRDELAGRIAPFIKRRTKKLVAAELPEKSEVILFCEMDPVQRRLYDSMLARARGRLAQAEQEPDQAQSRMMIFTELLRLRQLCCDPALLPDNAGKGAPSAKMELARELIMENIDSRHRMLLFSQFTSLLALIREHLDGAGIPYEYLDGATRNRFEHVDAFNNNSDIPIFLLSIKAGGSGLNLTSADRVIIYDPWWNPAVENQAADRTHRIGQTRQVTSVKLVVKDSIEERILELQKRKQDIFDGLIENPASGAGELTLEDLKFLLN